MDLGNRSINVDLTEAPRLVLPTSTPTSLPNPSQIQPPHFSMIMQQAVAMQQFQFQQALLMQQVMATQQAAARAANVKSATEMAAARAAEISKQLKGSDVEDEPVNTGNAAAPSPNRSRSAPSHSRSASRSRSHSPVRYRRGRSVSRSPIRYRRDRVSPLRSRDQYVYRSRSRRGYRGGRGDHLWNSYRRDWDRDRDYYPRPHRSRSRSRVRRRSRSGSRSPWSHRERSLSPRNHRDECKSAGSSRRFRSKESRRSPSDSGRSHSASAYKKAPSTSPKDDGEGTPKEKVNQNRVHSASPVGKMGSPTRHNEGVKKADWSGQMLCRDVSVSPICSLSVSVSPSSKFRKVQDSVVQSDLGQSSNQDWCLPEPLRGVTRSPKEVKIEAEKCSNGLGQEGKGSRRLRRFKQDISGRQGRHVRSAGHCCEEVDDESEDNKGVDDWRDDVKLHGREKNLLKETKDCAQKLEEPRVRSVTGQGSTLVFVSTEQEEPNTCDLKAREVRPNYIAREAVLQLREQSLPGDSVFVEHTSPEHLCLDGSGQEGTQEGRGAGADRKVTSFTTPALASEDEGETSKGKDAPFVFEGPNLAFESYVATVELPKVPSLSESDHALSSDYLTTKSTESGVDPKKSQRLTHLKPGMFGDEEVNGLKLKARNRAKEDRRSKDMDSRRGSHGKLKRKHPREEVLVDENVDECEEEEDGRKEKRRHKKKHRREDDETKRKRRKHKHRKLSSVVSPRLSVGVDAIETMDGLVSPLIHKKTSRRRKKRSRCSSRASHMSASSSD